MKKQIILLLIILLAFSANVTILAAKANPPIIKKLSLDKDSLPGGARVIISGQNFTADAKLSLGDSEITDFTIKNSHKISFRVPPQLQPGARTLSIKTNSGIAQQKFEIAAKPLTELGGVEITTVAGGIAYPGDGNIANGDGIILSVAGLAVDKSDNILIADQANGRIRQVNTSTGIINTLAGNGSKNINFAAIAALTVGIAPTAIATDSAGNLFIAESSRNRVRRVDRNSGIITIVAGNGKREFSGDDRPATDTGLNNPQGLAVDGDGNLFIADQDNYRVRRVDARTGIITTVAGNGTLNHPGDEILAVEVAITPFALALDRAGNLFISESFMSKVRRVDASTGIITTVAGNGVSDFRGDNSFASSASLNFPQGIAIDAAGNLYIADRGNGRIRFVETKIDRITTVAGNGDGTGNDGVLATKTGIDPISVAVDSTGNIFIGEFFTNRVRKVEATSRIISTIAGNSNRTNSGDGGLATTARLVLPTNIAIDKAGNLFIADRGTRRVRKVTAGTGIITTVAGNGAAGLTGDGGPATSASLFSPTSVAIDGAGNLFIADGSFIRRVEASTGIITTIAGKGGPGLGDNGPALTAGLSSSVYITMDKTGNLLIADTGNHRIRKIDAQTNLITTIAGSSLAGSSGDGGLATLARLNFPSSVTTDATGNIFIADSANHLIRKVDTNGFIFSIAGNGKDGFGGDGGIATDATLSQPNSVVIDSANNIFIADSDTGHIRRIDARTSIITTIAGNGDNGYGGDNSLANKASFNFPFGLAIDNTGNLFIADANNNAIRAVKGIAK